MPLEEKEEVVRTRIEILWHENSSCNYQYLLNNKR
jgi:hypothetical protein